MPAQDRVRPDHVREAEQFWPKPCDPDDECSISSAQSEPPRSLPHCDIELMAQIHVLDLKPMPRLEPVEAERKEQEKQDKHRESECADSGSHCQAQADGIFGRDTSSIPVPATHLGWRGGTAPAPRESHHEDQTQRAPSSCLERRCLIGSRPIGVAGNPLIRRRGQLIVKSSIIRSSQENRTAIGRYDRGPDPAN
jgi:hypothetical protein